VQPAHEHPVAMVVTDDLRRNRLTVFFRWLLVIPHLIVLVLWAVVVEVAVIVAWFAALITRRVPDGLHDFMASFLRYATRISAYVLLLADPFPPFGGGAAYPLDLNVERAQPQPRVTVLFRLFLAVPALVLTYVFRTVNGAIAVLAWFYCLATGRMHEGLRNTSAWLLRYEVQTYAYLLLLTGRYPSLAGAPTVS
jgi:hypothetical protein